MTSQSLFQSIWEYEVRQEFRSDFIRAYSPKGLWARLFGRCPGYIKTELKRDVENPNRFVTIDHWQSAAAFSSMKQIIGDEYEELDNKCEACTLSENHIGLFGNV